MKSLSNWNDMPRRPSRLKRRLGFGLIGALAFGLAAASGGFDAAAKTAGDKLKADKEAKTIKKIKPPKP